jgi:hypothetical protein
MNLFSSKNLRLFCIFLFAYYYFFLVFLTFYMFLDYSSDILISSSPCLEFYPIYIFVPSLYLLWTEKLAPNIASYPTYKSKPEWSFFESYSSYCTIFATILSKLCLVYIYICKVLACNWLAAFSTILDTYSNNTRYRYFLSLNS